jgi:hypothetical protein
MMEFGSGGSYSGCDKDFGQSEFWNGGRKKQIRYKTRCKNLNAELLKQFILNCDIRSSKSKSADPSDRAV